MSWLWLAPLFFLNQNTVTLFTLDTNNIFQFSLKLDILICKGFKIYYVVTLDTFHPVRRNSSFQIIVCHSFTFAPIVSVLQMHRVSISFCDLNVTVSFSRPSVFVIPLLNKLIKCIGFSSTRINLLFQLNSFKTSFGESGWTQYNISDGKF